MRSVLESAARRFSSEAHIRNVLAGEWVHLLDEEGRPLPGIRGRVGASAVTLAGIQFGADAVEMQPGSAFPLHVHPGDHLLYVIHGQGLVHVDGRDHPVSEGDTIFIPAEYPHGVKTHSTGPGPLLFLAVGHPHKRLDAPDRMRLAQGPLPHR